MAEYLPDEKRCIRTQLNDLGELLWNMSCKLEGMEHIVFKDVPESSLEKIKVVDRNTSFVHYPYKNACANEKHQLSLELQAFVFMLDGIRKLLPCHQLNQLGKPVNSKLNCNPEDCTKCYVRKL